MRLSKRDKALTKIEIPAVHSIYFRGKRYDYKDYLKIKDRVSKDELLALQKIFYLLLIIKTNPDLINTKEMVPIKNQSFDSYFCITASQKIHKPVLNNIIPKNARKFFLIFDFIN